MAPEPAAAACCRKPWVVRASRYLTPLLWLLILSAFSCFLYLYFAFSTDWYNGDSEYYRQREDMAIPMPKWVKPFTVVMEVNGRNTTVVVARMTALLSGTRIYPIVVSWSCVLLAAVCVPALVALRRAERAANPCPSTDGQYASCPCPTFRRKAVLLARAMLSRQLPPRNLWAWWCGGLSVLDLSLVLLWFGIAFIWIWYYMQAHLQFAADDCKAKAAKAPAGTAAAYELDCLTAKRLNHAGAAFGAATIPLLLIMFFPVSRSSFLKDMCGTSFSSLVRYHRWAAYGFVGMAFAHGLLHMIEYGAAGTLGKELAWRTVNPRERTTNNTAGVISLVAALFMALTAHSWFRGTYFKIFHYTHLLGAPTCIIFALIHWKYIVSYILPGLLLYCLDRVYRWWQLMNVVKLAPGDARVLGGVITLRLRWRKGTPLSPGQTVYLRAPGASLLESHPFTLSDAWEEDDAACGPHVSTLVHIKVTGDWTASLKKLVAAGQGLTLQVEGPYDSYLASPPSARTVVLLAGGIGITPILSLLNTYNTQRKLRTTTTTSNGTSNNGSNSTSSKGTTAAAPIQGCPLPQSVYLVWTCRALCEFRLLGSTLMASAAAPWKLGSAKGDTGYPVVSSPKRAAAAVTGECVTSATGGSGWLQACLHYTGFEASLPQPSSDCDGHGKAKDLATSSSSSHSSHACSSTSTGSHSCECNALGHSQEACPTPFLPSASEQQRKPRYHNTAASSLAAPAAAATACPGTTTTTSTYMTTPSKLKAYAAEARKGVKRPSRLLEPHPATASPLLHAACVVLALLGAFAGVVLENFYMAYMLWTTPDGGNYPSVGTVQFWVIGIFTCLPPAMLLGSIKLIKNLQNKRKGSAGAHTHTHTSWHWPCRVQCEAAADSHSSGSAVTAVTAVTGGLQPSPFSLPQVQGLGPEQVSCQLAAAAEAEVVAEAEALPLSAHHQPLDVLPAHCCSGCAAAATASATALCVGLPAEALEEGCAGMGACTSLPLERGRPNLRALLTQVQEAHAGEEAVEVLVGGPEPMYLQALEVCSELGALGACKPGLPLLLVRRVVSQH